MRSVLATLGLVAAALAFLFAPAAAQTKAVLTRGDFVYAGTLPLPATVGPLSTLYRTVGLATRRVGAELRVFVVVEGQGDLEGTLAEFRVDGPEKPLALVRTYGRVWRTWPIEGQAVNAIDFEQSAADGSGRLWFLHASFYHVTSGNDPHLSVATFEGDAYASSVGPLNVVGPGVSYNKTRSGLTRWRNGARLIGAGGHVAGVGSASLGLFAGQMPAIPSPELPVEPLVDHGFDFTRAQRRPCDYDSHTVDGGRWPQPPDCRWTWGDTLETLAYIDTGTRHGVVAIGEQVAGEVIYGPAGSSGPNQVVHTAWYVWDPEKLATAGGRSLEPDAAWRVGPGGMGDPDYGRQYRENKDGINLPLNGGLAYDATSGLAFVLAGKLQKALAGAPEYERWPGILVFKVGPGQQAWEFCGNGVDDNGDGRVDEGCPVVGGALRVDAQCTAVLHAAPPDTKGGWSAQFYQGTAKVGTADSAAPYERTTSVVAGAYAFRVRWTKSGQTAVESAVVPWTCR